MSGPLIPRAPELRQRRDVPSPDTAAAFLERRRLLLHLLLIPLPILESLIPHTPTFGHCCSILERQRSPCKPLPSSIFVLVLRVD